MSSKILLVEDDKNLGDQIVSHLARDGFEVTWLRDGSSALDAEPKDFDLIVLDLMLPGAHGLDILKIYRETAETPVLVLSARNETSTKVRSLALGADDYVTKPFWPEELLARIQARLRRPLLHATDVIETGALRIDVNARVVENAGQKVDLTRIEFDLLAALAQRLGSAITRQSLVDRVLDPDREGTSRTLDVHFSRVRKKLGSEGGRIATVWGVGYRLLAT
ncbi:MAG: response regulator transcription factor [Vicinamibacteria bacterium]